MVMSAFRNVIEIKKEDVDKGKYFVSFEEIIKFIQDNFCEAERDIMVAMLLSLDLKNTPKVEE